MTERALFDADAIRRLERRTVFVRRVERPTLVLGSTQNADIVDPEALVRHGVELVRRRSGGGAVLLEPDRALWIDTWVPRADILWSEDITKSSSWVGSWWADSLATDGLEVHHGSPIASRWSNLICFAGVAAGEVVHRGRKVVGVAQWRSRDGAFAHSLAYLAIEWDRMTELLGLGRDGSEAARELGASTSLVGDLSVADSAELTATLLDRLPDSGSWTIQRTVD